MLPGDSRILTCPHCGSEKEVLSLMSGNTFGAKYWSDSKMDAPMLPSVSYIQKCPNCGKYYLANGQEAKYRSGSCSFEQGKLTFEESVEALACIIHRT